MMTTLQKAAKKAEMALSLLVEHDTAVGGSTARALAALRDALPVDRTQRDSYEQSINDADWRIQTLEDALRWIRLEAQCYYGDGTDRHEACANISAACNRALGEADCLNREGGTA
jgi:hypothetical protein